MGMKRMLLAAMAVLMAAVAAGAGVTYALFTASTGPANNQITAGTLEIESFRDNGDTVPGPMFYIGPGGGLFPTGHWAPGDEVHRVLQVENVGSLDGWLKHVRATLTAGDRSLADQLLVTVSTDPGKTNVIASGTLGDFIDADQTFAAPISIDVWDLIDLHFFVKLPLSTSNSFQGQSAEVSFTVYAEQKRNNP